MNRDVVSGREITSKNVSIRAAAASVYKTDRFNAHNIWIYRVIGMIRNTDAYTGRVVILGDHVIGRERSFVLGGGGAH